VSFKVVKGFTGYFEEDMELVKCGVQINAKDKHLSWTNTCFHYYIPLLAKI